MPFKSSKQKRYMYSQHPEIAKRWSAKEKKGKKRKPTKKRGRK